MQNISLFDEEFQDVLSHEALHEDKDVLTVNDTVNVKDDIYGVHDEDKKRADGTNEVAGEMKKHEAQAEMFWQSCLNELKQELKEGELNQWLRSLKPMFMQDEFVLFAINDVFIRRIEAFYYDKICEVAMRLAKEGDAQGQILNIKKVALKIMPLTSMR